MFPPKLRLPIGLIAFLLIAGAAGWLSAATIALTPVADTTLFQASPDNNLGGELFLSSGSTDEALINRALLRFDIAGHIPANANIQSLTLTLTVTHSTASQASSFSLHRVIQNWGEGTKASGGIGAPASSGEATWNARIYPAPSWTAPGAAATTDYVATASATQTIAAEGGYAFGSSLSLLADVQNWFTNSGVNFGWILICEDELSFSTAQSFASREDPTNGPKLVIDYILPTRPKLTLTPVADTSLFELIPTNNLGGADLVSGTIGSQGDGKRSRALIQFSTASFPSNAVLTAATLGLTVVEVPSENGQAASTFDLHRLVQSWQEGDKGLPVSRNHGSPADPGETTWGARFFPSILWSTPGAGAPGDYLPLVTSKTTVSGLGTYFFTNLLEDVQFWLTHPDQNYGWIMIGEDEAQLYTARIFGSREDAANTPTLQLEYIPVPRIYHSEVVGSHFNLYYVAQAGLASAVQYRNSLSTNGNWITLTNLPALFVTQTNVITAPFSPAQPQRFYRVGLQ